MIIKIVSLFLVVMVALALFGKLRFPRLGQTGKCPGCGRYRIGRGPCPCGKDGGRRG